jgi:phosphoenolpyruvate carboxykinase (GTP)
MLPFCGYHMGDYFQHWLDIGSGAPDPAALPRMFQVNWFRKDADGRYLWPGYGENSRVLEWIFRRCEGTAEALDTPIGAVPTPASLDTDGLDVSDADVAALLAVDHDAWVAEAKRIADHLRRFGDRLPAALREELAGLRRRLSAAGTPD